MDLLAYVNELDTTWHDQTHTFEREAITRFWGLLTLPARALDPALPARLLKRATVVRNARFTGATVQEMFFENQAFTEVDALFFNVGSPLGHLSGDDAWVVEVERKTGYHQGDYFRAIHRARRFAQLLNDKFGVRARPVMIYEDGGGKLSYQTFEGDVLLITMSTLRERTRGLSFHALTDIPGAAFDRTLVKLALLTQLVRRSPHQPGPTLTPTTLARLAESSGHPVRLTVQGHQHVDTLPSSLAAWFQLARQHDDHLAARVTKYLTELRADGLLDPNHHAPRLTLTGGNVVLKLLQHQSAEAR